jgi:hypothetical protein
MVRQVIVDLAGSDGAGSDQGECRERLGVVEGGDLGNHPADADAGQVRRAVVELTGERCGVGPQVAQGVRRRLGVDSGRRTSIAQVVPHDVAPAARQLLAELVGPGEQGRAAGEQHQPIPGIAEVLDPERDAVRLDRRRMHPENLPKAS